MSPHKRGQTQTNSNLLKFQSSQQIFLLLRGSLFTIYCNVYWVLNKSGVYQSAEMRVPKLHKQECLKHRSEWQKPVRQIFSTKYYVYTKYYIDATVSFYMVTITAVIINHNVCIKYTILFSVGTLITHIIGYKRPWEHVKCM